MNSDYTKKIFAETLMELLKTSSIDKIKIKTICETCGLSKKTFYYHFKDKYDLAAYLYNSLLTDSLSELVDISDYFQAFAKGMPELNETDGSSVEIVRRIFNLWNSEQKEISKNLVLSDDINSPQSLWYANAIKGRKELLHQRLAAAGKVLPEDTIDLAASILCLTSQHYYALWNKRDRSHLSPESVRELTDMLNNLIDFFLSQAK